MSIEGSRRLASVAFVLLLALSVVWPDPVVAVNELCCHADIAVDDLSFLGREAPSWDVVYWCIVGLFVIALLTTPDFDSGAIREELRNVRVRKSVWLIGAVGATAIVVSLVWRFADAPVLAAAERVDSNSVDSAIRIANRFGGGMNPLMVVGFFMLAGAAYRSRHWIWCGIAMAYAGAAAGILVQVMKYAVGRTRPELWLGPFHHARASYSSFPSGHTVGAFALAGVLMFNAESKALRVFAALVAIAVGVSRVLAFRHWPSDVIASAAIGLLVAGSISVGPAPAGRLEQSSHDRLKPVPH